MSESKLLRIYWQGNSAFYDGFKEENCPYYGDKEMTAWLMGFRDGQDNVITDSNDILDKIN
jgi:ribosome modulation factor